MLQPVLSPGAATWNKAGLLLGIEAVLSVPMIKKPVWVKTDKHHQMFEELKEKYQTEKDAENEINMFKVRQEKDDSNFIIYFK